MSKYARYSIWLAKAIVVFTAVLSFVKFFVTYDDVYAAMFAASVSVFMALDIYGHMTELKERCDKLSEWVVRISDRAHARSAE